MKKKLIIGGLSTLIFVICVATLYIRLYKIPKGLEYSREYVMGEGKVDVDDLLGKSEDFDIGANEEGYAVFKNPGNAFRTLKTEYRDGIDLIRREFHLFPLSQLNYGQYGTYGWQVSGGTEEEIEQAKIVSTFLDIYENSFVRH